MFTSDTTIRWVECLAEQEKLIHSGESTSIDISRAKDDVLEAETVRFIRELYYCLEYLSKVFNKRITVPSMLIKLKQEGDVTYGFSLDRNGIKLRVLPSKPGVVCLQCDKVETEVFLAGLSGVNRLFSGIVEAKFESFHEVKWYFLGSALSIEQLCRHYLMEFLQVSRSSDTN